VISVWLLIYIEVLVQIDSQGLGLASSGQGFFPSNVPARRHSGGWCVDRFGPRKTLLGATVLSLGTLLIEVLDESAAVIFVGDLLTGLLTGSFPILGPAYISEILPVTFAVWDCHATTSRKYSAR
jgi:MFS family permease